MIESRHAVVFKRKLAEHRQVLLEGMAQMASADIGAYRQLSGQIQGLADALKLSDDADFEINGG